MAPAPTLLRPALSGIALVIAIVVALYVGIGAIKARLGDSFETERAISDAQRATDLAIRRQLVEESAVRGFVGSGRRVLLEPYVMARAQIATTFETLDAAIFRLDMPEERAYVSQAAVLNGQWEMLVARPLLGDRHRRDAAFLEVRGKTLVDRYRAAINHVDRALAARAALETSAAAIAVSRVGVIGVLAVVFVGLVVVLSLRAQTRLGRELLVERRVAEAMQRGLLQSSLPSVANLGLDASYVPAGREALVGGDWYDIYPLPDGRVMFSIGDVAGHGIEAAILMSRAREAIVALGYDASDPAHVLARANDVLLLQNSQMATVIFGYVDPRTRAITYACAGHPPPLLAAPDAAPVYLGYGGIPLGIFGDQVYENVSVTAEPGGALVLYTDGLIERTRDLFAGENELRAAVDAEGHAGFDRLATRVHKTIFGESVPGDDAAIVTIAFLETIATLRGDGDDDRDASGLHSDEPAGRVSAPRG